jgi:Tol biopolymer transport system component
MNGNRACRGWRRGLATLPLLAAAPLGATELSLLNYAQPSVLGQQGNRDVSTSRFAASDDGRYVVFLSASNNLSADDPGDRADVFVKDALTGELTRITRRADGGEPNGSSYEATISGDGRWIFFLSNATDLVSPAPSGLHLYRVDRISGLVQQLTDTGTQTLYASAPSYDGSRVAFTTDAKLAAADTDSVADAYLWSQDSGAFTLLSVDSAGQPLPGVVDFDSAALSADGLSASFITRPLSGSANACGVFVRDLAQSLTDRVANPPVGQMPVRTSVSADARFVSFDTYEAVLPADGNGTRDVYVFDRTTRQAELVSVTALGTAGNAASVDAVLSRDGRYVVFGSTATNLAGSATGRQVFRRDRLAATTTRIAAATGELWYDKPALSGNGAYVVLATHESLAADDDNQRADVYAIDADDAIRLSTTHAAARLSGATTSAQLIRDAGGAYVLGDGVSVVYASGADNVGPSRGPALFRVDRRNGQTTDIALDALPAFPSWPTYVMLAGASADGSRFLVRREPLHINTGFNTPPPGSPWDLWRVDANGAAVRIDDPALVGTYTRTVQATLSDDGRYALFVVLHSPDNFTPYTPRVYLHDIDSGQLTRIDVGAQGATLDAPAQQRTGLSRNGRYAALVTAANNLVANDTDGSMDLFLRDNVDGTVERLRDPQTGAPLVSASAASRELIVISDDGQRIAFTDRIGPPNTSFTRLRFLDRTAGRAFTIFSEEPVTIFRQLSLDADGTVLAFVSVAPLLLDQDTDHFDDVYSYRLADETLRLESVDGDGAQGRGPRLSPRVSADGKTLTFQAVGSGWRTTPQVSGDSDWLFKPLDDAVFADGFEAQAR